MNFKPKTILVAVSSPKFVCRKSVYIEIDKNLIAHKTLT